MKRKLLFVAALAASALGFNANAQNFTGEPGKYYLQNVESGLYWGVGNSWATQASLIKNPEYVTLIAKDGGTYQMESQVSNGGSQYFLGYNNGYFMDNGNPLSLTISKAGDYYTIASGNNVFGYEENTTVISGSLESTSQNALWKIISEADMIASLKNATSDNPVNATFLLLDPNFNRNSRTVGEWEVSADCTNKNLAGGGGEKNPNACAESYHSVFTVSQTIKSAPKGLYKLTAQGFYRQDGTNDYDLPKFFITTSDGTSEANFPVKTGSEGNMGDAGNSFMNGAYPSDDMYIELSAEGSITVGTKLARNTALWCIWDNFTLTYYGDVSINDVELDYVASKKQSFSDLADEAEALYDEPMNKDVLAALKEASINVESYTTAVEISTAIAKLDAAIANAKHSMALYEATRNTLDEYETKVAKLDGNGQIAYDVEEIEAVYADRTMVEDQTIAVWEAFATATKAQTTNNADFTGAILNASVDGGDCWNGASIASGEHYSKDKSNTYLDANSGTLDAYQFLTGLPAGNYRVKVATRASSNLETGHIYMSIDGKDIATKAVNKQGNENGDLGNGWSWTECDFTLTTESTVRLGIYAKLNNTWVSVDDWQLTLLELTPATDKVEITNAKYTAYVTKFNVDFTNTGVKAYKVTNATTASAELEEITEAPKGEAVILYSDVEGDAEQFTLTQTKDVVTKITDNKFLSGDGKVKGDGETIYALGNIEGNVGFYLVAEGTLVPETKGYLEITGGGDVKNFIPFGDGDATGIESVETQKGIETGVIYNLAGQRVVNPTNGIYIVNGKKVLINK